MILDWKKHCEKIHKTHMLERGDPSDNKSLFSQESHYIKYLEYIGLEYRDIFMNWAKIKNGIASAFKDDPEQRLSTFKSVCKAASNINVEVFEHYYKPIYIYEVEIKKINSVKAPKWVKQYWLSMLVYWKFAKQYSQKVRMGTTLCNWAMRHTSLKDCSFGHHRDEIAFYNNNPEGRIMEISFLNKSDLYFYSFEWVSEEYGEKQRRWKVSNINKFAKVIKMISSNFLICSKCGKLFEAKDKQRTSLCPECYKKHRRIAINNNAKKYYNKKEKEDN